MHITALDLIFFFLFFNAHVRMHMYGMCVWPEVGVECLPLAPLVFETDFRLNLELTDSDQLAGQQALESIIPPSKVPGLQV